ncbi:MAG: hypothetical protein OXH63_23080 [Gemmatimonadetes bacterium]|nr:hypothetical protein [Gemmatimonadota bacterium]
MAQTDSRTLELIREVRLLKDHYPHGKATLKAGVLRWTGELQPSEVSRQYQVGLRYAPPYYPRVFVRRPKLVHDADGNLPHIYPDGSLCLHEPDQWTPGDPIAKTILPWTSEWLLHYELWRATGEWCGSGGNHTGPINKAITTRRSHSRSRSKEHVNDRNQRVPADCGDDLEEG